MGQVETIGDPWQPFHPLFDVSCISDQNETSEEPDGARQLSVAISYNMVQLKEECLLSLQGLVTKSCNWPSMSMFMLLFVCGKRDLGELAKSSNGPDGPGRVGHPNIAGAPQHYVCGPKLVEWWPGAWTSWLLGTVARRRTCHTGA